MRSTSHWTDFICGSTVFNFWSNYSWTLYFILCLFECYFIYIMNEFVFVCDDASNRFSSNIPVLCCPFSGNQLWAACCPCWREASCYYAAVTIKLCFFFIFRAMWSVRFLPLLEYGIWTKINLLHPLENKCQDWSPGGTGVWQSLQGDCLKGNF